MNSLISAPAPAQNHSDRNGPLFRFEILAAIGCCVIAIYGLCFWCYGFSQVLRIVGVAILVGGAALLTGFLLGFIFGVPRVRDSKPETDSTGAINATAGKDSAQASSITPNNNLVEISDWLTKIIVGVGLVELKSILRKLGDFSWDLAPSLCPLPRDAHPIAHEWIATGQAAGLAIMIFYFALGFLFGYVWTRLYFQRDLSGMLASLLNQVQASDLILLAEASINEHQFDKAMSTIDKAIENDPKDGRAVLTKARIFKRQAGDAQPPERDQLLNQAVTYADRAIALLPGKGEPIYNKACYLAQLNGDKGAILANLRAAFNLNPALRNTAKADDDLSSLRQDIDFKQLVGIYPPPAA